MGVAAARLTRVAKPTALGAARVVPVVAMGAGLLAMVLGVTGAPVAAQGASPVVAALEAYGTGTVTFSITPVSSAPSGAWVSIMDPVTGYVFTKSFESQALVAGQATHITVPLNLPQGQILTGFNSFVEIPAQGDQAVVLAAETQAVPPPPIPFIPPPNIPPPIPNVPPTKPPTPPTPTVIPSVPPHGGSSHITVVLPKTGAGSAMEFIGALLFLAGGLGLVLRPRRHRA